MNAGLRPRFVAVLILTSALSLLVAAAALLPPLASRVQRRQLAALTATALAQRRAVARLPSGRRWRRALEQRIGAQLFLVDAGGRSIIGPVHSPRRAQALQALSSGRPVTSSGSSHGAMQLAVAVPATVDGRPAALLLERTSADAQLAASVVRRAFLLAGLIGLGVSALAGAVITGRLLRRLRALRDTALAGTGGAVDAHRDEVGDLARALATMQRDLLRQEHARRRFVATASHELRTPLASLGLTLELLESGNLEPEEVAAKLRRAHEQTRRLGALCDDLLDLSRVDAAVPLRAEPVDAVELCRAVSAEFEQTVLHAPAGRCWMRADPSAVARILAILLDNAVRVGGAPIDVTVAETTIVVADHGPGVPPGEREAIFERFTRGSSAGGFGLGLAIGRELATQMGGSLELEDSEVGARFALRLPLDRVETAVELTA